MSIALVRLILLVELAKPTAVDVLVCIGVGGCGYQSSCNVMRKGAEIWQLRKIPSISASVAEAMILRSKRNST